MLPDPRDADSPIPTVAGSVWVMVPEACNNGYGEG